MFRFRFIMSDYTPDNREELQLYLITTLSEKFILPDIVAAQHWSDRTVIYSDIQLLSLLICRVSKLLVNKWE